MVVENNIRAAAILRDIAQRIKELARLIDPKETEESHGPHIDKRLMTKIRKMSW